MDLNLARSPFTNTRPVVRVTVLLWSVAVAAAIVVFFLYWDPLFGLEARARELSDLERAIEAEQAAIAETRSRIEAMDLTAQNAQAAYLTEQIRERRFPWSHLFEDLGEVMPREVRFFSLSPVVGDDRDEALTPERARNWRARADGSGRILLNMSGGAADDEAMLRLLDNLFASPDFEEPTLPRESRAQDGSLRFDLSVHYLPEPGSVPDVHVVELEADPSEISSPRRPAGEGPVPREEERTAARRETDEDALARGPERSVSPTRVGVGEPPSDDLDPASAVSDRGPVGGEGASAREEIGERPRVPTDARSSATRTGARVDPGVGEEQRRARERPEPVSLKPAASGPATTGSGGDRR